MEGNLIKYQVRILDRGVHWPGFDRGLFKEVICIWIFKKSIWFINELSMLLPLFDPDDPPENETLIKNKQSRFLYPSVSATR